MTELVITRGLPGSGKTTWAKQWVSEEPLRVRVNRDDLRMMLYGRSGVLEYLEEEAVSASQRWQVEGFLQQGRSVVVDDTHLRLRYSRPWATMAQRLGVDFKVKDFTDVPLDTCVSRDFVRGLAGQRAVGHEVIRTLHARFLAKSPLPEVTPLESDSFPPYTPPVDRPRAIIVDIDGTVALMNGRGPFDWSRVGEDVENVGVCNLLRRLKVDPELEFIYVSGRDEVCRKATRQWLVEQSLDYTRLFMRPQGSREDDRVVKRRIFDDHIRDNYNVIAVLDDRKKVVKMWRDIGLTCLQVAEGDF